MDVSTKIANTFSAIAGAVTGLAYAEHVTFILVAVCLGTAIVANFYAIKRNRAGLENENRKKKNERHYN